MSSSVKSFLFFATAIAFLLAGGLLAWFGWDITLYHKGDGANSEAFALAALLPIIPIAGALALAYLGVLAKQTFEKTNSIEAGLAVLIAGLGTAYIAFIAMRIFGFSLSLSYLAAVFIVILSVVIVSRTWLKTKQKSHLD